MLRNLSVDFHDLGRFVFNSILALWAVAVLVGIIVERVRPVQANCQSLSFNLRYMAVVAWISYLLTPLVGGVVAVAATYSRGGWIVLPEKGISFFFSVLVLLAAKDFLDYWVHRAQHRFSFLWKMHSFHHSDPAMNVATAQRHYWLERPILALAVYPLVGIVFRVTPALAVAFSIGNFFWSFFPHMNLRISLGKFSSVVLGPQLHRIHHSALPEHYDCNFAGVFPLWDVIFGTYRAPKKGEFPPTGIGDRNPPNGILDAVLWPIRH